MTTTNDTASTAFRLVPLTPEETGLEQSVIERAQGAPNPHPAPQAQARHNGGITDIVFDFGQVLINWDPYGPLSARYSDELIRQFRINDISGFDDANDSTDNGHDLASAVEIMRRKGELWAQMMDFYLARFPQSLMGEVPGAHQLVDDLHAAGYKCWGLSNWSPQNFKDAWYADDIFDRLDGFLVSGFIHDIKPHRSIFDRAAHAFGFDPAQAVFIDDKPGNIEAAKNAGWSGVVQRTPQQVRTELIGLGVEIPPVRQTR
jgi:putative hydrolase of the HAD superfamily